MIIVDVTGDKVEIRVGSCPAESQVEVLFTNHQHRGENLPGDAPGVPVEVQAAAVAAAAVLASDHLREELIKVGNENRELVKENMTLRRSISDRDLLKPS